MIRVHVRRGVLGEAAVETHRVEWRGQTAAELVEAFRRPEWAGLPVGAAMSGRSLDARELGLGLPDDVDLVIAPSPGFGLDVLAVVLTALITAVVSAGVSAAIAALTPKPKGPGDVVQRGDEASQTYAWSGIATTTGQGVPMPIVAGEHDVGGHVIWSEVRADSQGGVVEETLRVMLALCEGRIESIGGVTGGDLGEADGLGARGGGPLPLNVRVGQAPLLIEAPVASAWVRCGELDQSPLPDPFVGTRVTQPVSEELTEASSDVVYLINDPAEIASIDLLFGFPAGLYFYDPQNNPVERVWRANIQWRPAGQGNIAWRNFAEPLEVLVSLGQPVFGNYALTVRRTFAAGPVLGPIEVRVQRVTPSAGSRGSDRSIWRTISWVAPHVFGYPRTAILGLEVPATTQGSQNSVVTFRARVRGSRVRCWDSVNGWSPRVWDRPPAPWNYLQYPIGSNPAWFLVEFLLAPWGLGKWLTEANLDLEAFARWGIYCDARPGPISALWSEPRFRIDAVIDRTNPGWESAQRIAAAGAAVVYMRGDRVSVVYRHALAHSAGPISVPAKVRSQLFSAPLLRDVGVRWLPVRDRPKVYEYTFLDAEKDYSQDRYRVTDPTASIDDPAAFERDSDRIESVEAYGVTRRSQLFRMGRFEHALGRLVRKEITFKVPHHALAAEIGDVVGVQTDFLRPYATESLGMTIAAGGTDVTEIAVDRDLTFAPGVTYQVLVRTPVGDVDQADIAAPAGTYAAGTLIALAGPVDCDPGAPAAVGVRDAVVEDYEIVAISLERDFSRNVQALLWTPDAYVEPTVDDYLAAGGSAGPLAPASGDPTVGDQDLAQSTTFAELPRVDPAEITIRPVADARNRWRISFARPVSRPSSRARVYVRPVASSAPWMAVAETIGSHVEVEGLGVWSRLEVCVTVESLTGQMAAPSAADAASLEVPELSPSSPPDVHDAEILPHPDGVLVRWRPIDGADVVDYEVRRGESWHEAVRLGRTTGSEMVDRLPRTFLGDAYWIAARNRHGLFSAQPSNAQDRQGVALMPPPAAPHLANSLVAFDASAGGSLVDVEWAADEYRVIVSGLRHAGAKLEGRYTAPELVLRDGTADELQALAWWTAKPTVALSSLETLDEWNFRLDSVEARSRSVWFRPPTPSRPGVGSESILQVYGGDTIEGLLARKPDLVASGLQTGELGRRFALDLWSRYYRDGEWSDWAPHVDGPRVASRIQVEVRMLRADLSIRLYMERLNVTVHV